MKGRSLVGIAASLTVLGVSLAALAEPVSLPYLIAQVKLTEESRVATNGMGPVLVGMTIEEASRSAGIRLVQRTSGGESRGCYYYKPQAGLQGVSFMVIQGRIVRVDVYQNPRIATLRGIRIGDSEERVRSLYPGQIRKAQTVSSRVKALAFVPKDAEDRNYRIIFQLRENRVVHFRSGRLPEVEYIEGCV